MNIPELKLQDAIDLLAEGELDRGSRDSLLARLDLDPSGWKRCALALLEQRALQQSIDTTLTTCSLSPLNSKATSQSALPVWHRFIGLAATALILITIGWIAGIQAGSSAVRPLPNRIADQPADQTTPAEFPANDEMMRQVSFALASTGTADAELVAMVRVGDESNQKFLPIVRSNELAQKMTALPDPKLAPDAARKLQQSGWELNKHQQFISFKLPNGITKALPVDMLTYRYVGRETF